MQVLSELLAQNRTNSPIFTTSSGKLSNHLSMALLALDRMGAKATQMTAYAKSYSSRLEPIPQITIQRIIDEKNWEEYLGLGEYFPNYLSFFQERITTIGVDQTLKNHVTRLLRGIAEFHGVIRLAYALESHDLEEIATALAYYSAHYYQYGKIHHSNQYAESPATGLATLRQNECLLNQSFKGRNIHERLNQVAKLPAFFTSIPSLSFNFNTIQQCSELLASFHAMTKDFVVLHGLTTTHALRVIWPYVNNHQEIFDYYWQILCAIYVYIGAPAIPTIPNIQMNTTWEHIFSKATNATDDHVIKLVYSCYEENKVYQNPLYIFIAARAVEDIVS